MTYILSVHITALFDISKLKKLHEFKQYVYRYDDIIGIYNPNNNTYNAFKSIEIESTERYNLEKTEKVNRYAPSSTIDDVYSENVCEYDQCKIIGSDDNRILQIEFNDYKKIK